MSSDLVLFQPRPISEISRFENFAVPARRLTPHEQVIYDRLASDWAQLDATAQTTLYAEFLKGKLTVYLTNAFADTLEKTYPVLSRFTDPTERAMMYQFRQASVQEDARGSLAFQQTAIRKMEGTLANPYPEAPRPKQNFWQRLLGRE